MIGAAELDRRRWLRACLALGLGPLLAPPAWTAGELEEFWSARATDELRRAAALARAAGASADGAPLEGFAGGGDAALAEFLAGKVRADFEADRVRWVGPWLLAETECQVLAAL